MKSNSPRRKIYFFGIFGSGNLGNEATLCAILFNLRRIVPDAEAACICSGPRETAAEYNISAFSMKEKPLSPVKNRLVRTLRRILVGIPMEFYRWYKAISILKGADMLVMTGTGMLGDFGILSTNLHYEIVKWSLAAKLCRCRLLFVSVGVGPIRSRASQILIKFALGLADYRSYRDGFSKEYLEGINFDTKKDAVFPDLAFSLPRTLIHADRDRDGRRTVVGVGIMTYHNRRDSSDDDSVYDNYIQSLSRFLAWLIDRQYAVRLLIGDAVYDEPVRRDLRRLLEERGIKYEESGIVDEPAASVEEVVSQLAATDIVVASRFHNVLLALYLAKPVVAISYHEKVEALMVGLGLAEFCQDIENINVEHLIEQFKTAEKCAEVLRPRIAEQAEVCRRALEEQYDRIFASTSN